MYASCRKTSKKKKKQRRKKKKKQKRKQANGVISNPAPTVHWRALLVEDSLFHLGESAGNMAGMGATTPGTISVVGPVQQGLKEALIETLTAILSPVQEVRAGAEEQIKVLEVTEGKVKTSY